MQEAAVEPFVGLVKPGRHIHQQEVAFQKEYVFVGQVLQSVSFMPPVGL